MWTGYCGSLQCNSCFGRDHLKCAPESIWACTMQTWISGFSTKGEHKLNLCKYKGFLPLRIKVARVHVHDVTVITTLTSVDNFQTHCTLPREGFNSSKFISQHFTKSFHTRYSHASVMIYACNSASVISSKASLQSIFSRKTIQVLW